MADGAGPPPRSRNAEHSRGRDRSAATVGAQACGLFASGVCQGPIGRPVSSGARRAALPSLGAARGSRYRARRGDVPLVRAVATHRTFVAARNSRRTERASGPDLSTLRSPDVFERQRRAGVP